MTENDRMVGHHLLEAGVVVPFRLLEHEILPAADQAEFGVRLKLRFEPDDEGRLGHADDHRPRQGAVSLARPNSGEESNAGDRP